MRRVTDSVVVCQREPGFKDLVNLYEITSVIAPRVDLGSGKGNFPANFHDEQFRWNYEQQNLAEVVD